MCDLVAITGISNVLQYLLVARWQSKYVTKQHVEKVEKDRQDTQKQQSAGQVLYDG